MEQTLNKLGSQIVMVYKGTLELAKTADALAHQLHQQRRERVRQELQRHREAMRVVLLEMRQRGLVAEGQRQVQEERQPQPDSPRSPSPPTTPEVIVISDDDDDSDDDYSEMSDVDETEEDRRVIQRK